MGTRWSILLTLFLVFIISSCSKKLMYKHKNVNTTKLKIRKLDLYEIKAKAKFIYINNNQEINAKANLRIKKDSIIWLHLSRSGIEGVRIKVLRTGISMLDRINKVAYEYSFNALSEKYNFDFNYEQLENLLFANLFVLPGQNEPKEIDNKQKYDVYQSSSNEIETNWVVNSDSLVIKKTSYIQKDTNKQLIVNYLNYTSLNNKLIPKHLKFEFSDTKKGDKSSKIEAILHLLKVESAKKPLKYPYTIPKKYELIVK